MIIYNSHLLKFPISVQEYKSLARFHFTSIEAEKNYGQFLPTYLIARCPLCGAPYTAQLDTNSLLQWTAGLQGGHSIFREDLQSIGCKHFGLAHHFINLNGLLPSEVPIFENNSEIPYVIPKLLKKNLENKTWVIMHALPICRIVEDTFQPSYQAYSMIYYTENVELLYQAYSSLRPYMGFPEPFANDADRDFWWNLGYWVREGRLRWLDAFDSELRLASLDDEFPYSGISGYRYGVTYRNGFIHLKKDWR